MAVDSREAAARMKRDLKATILLVAVKVVWGIYKNANNQWVSKS